jgi:hypothetical protein
MMLMQPGFVTGDFVGEMIEKVKKKKNIARISDIKFETFHEGCAAQILHLGPYGEAERPTVAQLHQWIRDNGFRLTGKHHEIYFNSPLRTAPEKLKTIIRQPYSIA